MINIQKLDFRPLPGLYSKHLQTIIPSYRSAGPPPESIQWLIDLGEGDFLSCEVSTPKLWKSDDPTLILIHGLGASHLANYMVRIARKALEKGYKVIRVNLRGCGSGKGLSKLPYNAGSSHDIFKLLEQYKSIAPASPVTLLGFSLGGNIAIKLAGELGYMANRWFQKCIAVCSPLDLKQTVFAIGETKHYFYELYYLNSLSRQIDAWIDRKVNSINELDEVMTAPMCGYKNADDYYQKCSIMAFLDKVRCTTHLLFAADDPFVDLSLLNGLNIADFVNVWVTDYGGHMGYLGRNAKEYDYYWMDQLLSHWLDDDFKSDLLI